jgi:nucleoid DNA-binding protein
MAKAGPLKDPMSKTQVVTEIAAKTGLSRKQVGASLDELSEIIGRHIKKAGPGKFAMPGLFKITTVRKPATKARKGINPFTKEEVMFKAKPARTVIKIRPLKKLKDMV